MDCSLGCSLDCSLGWSLDCSLGCSQDSAPFCRQTNHKAGSAWVSSQASCRQAGSHCPPLCHSLSRCSGRGGIHLLDQVGRHAIHACRAVGGRALQGGIQEIQTNAFSAWLVRAKSNTQAPAVAATACCPAPVGQPADRSPVPPPTPRTAAAPATASTPAAAAPRRAPSAAAAGEELHMPGGGSVVCGMETPCCSQQTAG